MKRSRRTTGHVRLVALFAVGATACSESRSRPFDPMKDEKVSASVAASRPASLTIHLDRSLSMSGYVQSEGSSGFSQVLRVVRGLASDDNAAQLRVFAVGAEQEINGSDLQRASFDPSFFSDTNTALDVTARAIKKAASEPSPGVHILVTDGVQSVSSGTTECAQGSDPTCVRQIFASLLQDDRWVGAFFLIYSHFDGVIPSELGISLGTVRSVRHTSKGLDDQRPFSVLVLTKELGELKWATTALIRRFKEASIRWHGIPLYHPIVESAFPRTTDIIEFDNNASFVQGNGTFSWLTVELDRNLQEGKSFHVKRPIALDRDDPLVASMQPAEVYSALRDQVMPLSVPPCPSDTPKPKSAPLSSEIVEVSIDAQRRDPLSSSVRAKWASDRRCTALFDVAVQIGSMWLPKWALDASTDDDRTAENATRIFGLRTLLEGLVSNSALVKEPMLKTRVMFVVRG
jgi:hypothetical protein